MASEEKAAQAVARAHAPLDRQAAGPPGTTGTTAGRRSGWMSTFSDHARSLENLKDLAGQGGPSEQPHYPDGSHLTPPSLPKSGSEPNLSNGLQAMLDPAGQGLTPEMIAQLIVKEKAMNVLREGITIADCASPDMPLIYANDGFARITGYSVEETIGRNCRFLQGPETDPAKVRYLRKCINEQKGCVVEMMNYKKTGEKFMNYLCLSPIFDGTGKLTHYVGIQSDISELVQRKFAEEDAKKNASIAAAATEAKSQFLARMSHEIRTPLNGMIAVGQLLAETALSPAQKDLVSTICCSGEALLTLITDILDFSMIEANKLALHLDEFELQSVLEAAIEIAGLKAAQKRLQVAYSIEADVPKLLQGDPHRLQQIVLNVLNNAVKFTDSGDVFMAVSAKKVVGSTQISEEMDDAKRGSAKRLRSSCADLYDILVTVKDTGIGIAAQDLKKLFQSFSQLDDTPTRKYGGSGLGLTISKRLCQAMGGDMWVESDGVGKGSTFSFTIKAFESNAVVDAGQTGRPSKKKKIPSQGSAFQPPPPPKTDVLSGKKVLLLEPHDMVRKVLADAMATWGVQCSAVSSEEAALACLAWPDSKASAKPMFDVIVTASNNTQLLKSLISLPLVAQMKLVLLVWPAASDLDGSMALNSLSAMKPEKQVGEMSTTMPCPYVYVHRPVRQRRLKLALEEIVATPALSAGGAKPGTSSENNSNRPGAGEKGSAQNLTSGKSKDSSGLEKEAATKLKVLIAEDNPINMKVALGILKRMGCTDVVRVEDGVQALDALNEVGGPDVFDVILVDLHMPCMGGLEVVREIRKKWPQVKSRIVAVTADAYDATRQNCLRAGFTHWIAKPFRLQDISAVLTFDP